MSRMLHWEIRNFFLIGGLLLMSCWVKAQPASAGGGEQAPAPAISTTAALNGAVIVSLATAISGATIYYTVDGSAPTTSSQIYEAPFLVDSNITVQAIAAAPGGSTSSITSRSFTLNIPSGTLVWSDEFSNATGANAPPNPAVWAYDIGEGHWGNNELETYCGWNSSEAPCSDSSPSGYVGTDGYLHIIANQPSAGVYTSARLKTRRLFSFQYGRIEFRARVPEAQGLWPTAWLMGNNIETVDWPACGEMDVLERANAATSPDWNKGSIHGAGFTGGDLGADYEFPFAKTAAGWHTYGMIWSKGRVSYYVDRPTRPYVTYTPASLSRIQRAVWPFDSGQASYIILNLAVGGSFPGNPDARTRFPSQMLVDYVRIYTN